MKIKRIVVLICALLIAVSTLVIPVSASESGGSPTPISDEVTLAEAYGRSALLDMPNAEVLVYAYDQIAKGVETSASEISVYDGTHPISQAELECAFDAYRRDYTHHFWLDNTYRISHTPETVYTLMPTYLLEGTALEAAKMAFEAESEKLLSGISSSMSEFERELILHDRLAEKVSYVDTDNAHNSYGAIVEGEAVCEGYAEALQYLLRRAGIQSFIAIGSSTNPATNTAEGHAWNYVKIDGLFYHVDLTWNDQRTELYHAYFNVTDTEISEDHVIDPALYALPICTAGDAKYFSVVGGAINMTPTVEYIASFFDKSTLKAHVYAEDDKNAVTEFFSANIGAIAAELGVTGAFSYGYSSLGHEVVLKIITCAHENLTHVPYSPALCGKDGNLEHYVCECGRLFSDASANTEVFASEVRIKASPHEYTEKITDAAHLKSIASSCLEYDSYWFDCINCDASAKDDPYAFDKFFTLDTPGAHNVSDEWSSDGESHFHACLNDGCSYKEDVTPCSGGTASCFLAATCSVCHQSYGRLEKHDFDLTKWGYRSEDGHAAVCSHEGCGAKDTIIKHTDENSDGKCDECDFTIPKKSALTITIKPDTYTTKELIRIITAAALVTVGVIVILAIIKSVIKKRKKNDK